MPKNSIEERINSIKYQIKQVERHLDANPETAKEMLSYLYSMLNELGGSVNNLSQVTCGDFQIEEDAEACFDAHMDKASDFFIIEKQVKGRRIFDDKPQTIEQRKNRQNVRPDRILYPTERAYNEGWKYGPIGIEIKKSGQSIGPIFTQVLEQRQSIYRSEHLFGARIMPVLFAIFPAKGIAFDIHSLSERQSIVSCWYCKYSKQIKIGTNGKNILFIGENKINIGEAWKPSTRKGHQGRQK